MLTWRPASAWQAPRRRAPAPAWFSGSTSRALTAPCSRYRHPPRPSCAVSDPGFIHSPSACQQPTSRKPSWLTCHRISEKGIKGRGIMLVYIMGAMEQEGKPVRFLPIRCLIYSFLLSFLFFYCSFFLSFILCSFFLCLTLSL